MALAARQRKKAATFVLLSSPLKAFALAVILYLSRTGERTAFQTGTIFAQSRSFSGNQNIFALFRGDGFAKSAGFTVGFSAVVVTIEMVLGFRLGVLFNSTFSGKRLFLTMNLLPITIARALLRIMFRRPLNGDIGAVPAVPHGKGLDVSLFSPNTADSLPVLLDVLQWTPFTFLIIYAGPQLFPGELLEASVMDRAGPSRSLVHMIMPVLRPVQFVAFFLRTIDALPSFDVIYVLTAGVPGTGTTELSIYKAAFESGGFGKADPPALVVLLCLVPFVLLIVKRITSIGIEAQR